MVCYYTTSMSILHGASAHHFPWFDCSLMTYMTLMQPLLGLLANDVVHAATFDMSSACLSLQSMLLVNRPPYIRSQVILHHDSLSSIC